LTLQMRIKFTKHASLKIKQRNIEVSDIEKVIQAPDIVLNDKFDNELVHFAGKINDKFLRVIVKYENNSDVVIISAFFDRRLK